MTVESAMTLSIRVASIIKERTADVMSAVIFDRRMYIRSLTLLFRQRKNNDGSAPRCGRSHVATQSAQRAAQFRNIGLQRRNR